MVVLATLLGALLTAAAPVSAEPTFTRAHLPSYPDRLCFESPVELDWEAIARRELKSFPIDNPSLEDLRQAWTAYSDLLFKADLPGTLKRMHFYLLTEKGPQRIVPEQLVGHVRYNFPTKDKPKLAGFHGEICLPRPKGVDDAGFVAASKVPLSWQTKPAALVRSGSTTRVQLESGSAILPPPGLNESATRVKAAYILSSPGLATQYVLVRRVSDPQKVDCEFIYDIYRWTKGLPVVASSAHGCDI
jgi:hypothetical protein